jgi:hypothetical protein
MTEAHISFGYHFVFSYSMHHLVQGAMPQPPEPPPGATETLQIPTTESSHRLNKEVSVSGLHTNTHTYTSTRHPKNKTRATRGSFSEKKKELPLEGFSPNRFGAQLLLDVKA